MKLVSVNVGLPRVPLLWGHFGENLTTEGLREDAVHIGDRFRIGSAELVVTELPALPEPLREHFRNQLAKG